ncbi:hypothetical protein [Streptomyces albidoflavus]|uniref:hypothetical protein n=1 Tax=Streptomyces albidoflavus TaxID=1886 RepID=UPI00225B18B6|nr:hypothetical protein [Streptomyces albidoflavus]MCX4444728.1 hypothetical protein [Streptomyces albidoflavus]
MNVTETCITETCDGRPVIHAPISICSPCAIETALAVLPLALANALTEARDAAGFASEPTPEPITATRLERAALAGLRVTNTPIGRRTVENAIRSMGGRCSSTRATALARWARNGSDLAFLSEDGQFEETKENQ